MNGSAITPSEQPLRIIFVSPMCILDVVSGAALDIRGILETLAAAGHSVQSYTASLFDANTEVNYTAYLGKGAASRNARGKVVCFRVNDVEHNVFITASSRGRRITREEKQAIPTGWRQILESVKPQIVITFGTSAVSQQMHLDARRAGAQLIFFLANAEIDAERVVKPGDLVITPSHFLAERYRAFADTAPQVLRSVIDTSRFLPPDERPHSKSPGLQRKGLVAFINPLPHKGLTLFSRLALRALSERPAMKFAVLEGRMTRTLVRRYGVDLAKLENIHWLPAQKNMRAVYVRTSILLVPSFCPEGLARCVPEAQLSGIPVLASGRGGLIEAFADSNSILPIPEHCARKYDAYPDDKTVDIWWDALAKLWDDDDAYMRAVDRTQENAAPFAPLRTRAAVRDFFEQIASSHEA